MGTLSAASVPVPALRSPTVTDPPPPAAALTWRAFAPAGQVTGEVRATPDAPAASVASVVRRLAPGQPTAIQLQVVARQPCRLLTAVEAQPEPSDLSGASNRLPVPRLRAEHVEPDLVSAHDVPADRVDDATRPGRTVGYALEGVHRQPAAAARDPRPTVAVRWVRRVGGVGSADVGPALPVAAVGEADVDDAVVAAAPVRRVGEVVI